MASNSEQLSFDDHRFMTTHNNRQHERPATPAERVWGRPALDEMRGFLPLRAPCILTNRFQPVDVLLRAMPATQHSATNHIISGLLATNTFRKATLALPDFSLEIEHLQGQLTDPTRSEQIKDDIAFDCAMLFRDYQYLKTGYLLEPSLHDEPSAQTCLPENIARPLFLLADLFEQPPWLNYASGLVLTNSNFGAMLRPCDSSQAIRSFRELIGGTGERDFQTAHAAIEWETPLLFSALNSVFINIHTGYMLGIRKALNDGVSITQRMLATLKLMPLRLNHYETSTMPSIHGQVGAKDALKPVDAHEVFFEGCGTLQHNGKTGLWYNGLGSPTGAQSAILPLLDNALGISQFYSTADLQLQEMNARLQACRPTPHTGLLERVKATERSLGVRATLKQTLPLQLAQWCHTVCQLRTLARQFTLSGMLEPALKTAPKKHPIDYLLNIDVNKMLTPAFFTHAIESTLDALDDALDAVKTQTRPPSEIRLYNQLRQDAERMRQNNSRYLTNVCKAPPACQHA